MNTQPLRSLIILVLLACGLLLTYSPAEVSHRSEVVDCRRFRGDLAAKLNACIAAVPPHGGVADASGITGDHVLNSALSITKPTRLRMGCATWVLASGISVASSGFVLESSCAGQSFLRRAPGYKRNLIAYSGTGYSGLEITGIVFDNGGFRGANQDSSAVIYLFAGNHHTSIHGNHFLNLGTGRAIASGGYRIAQQDVRIEDNEITGDAVLAAVASNGLVRQSGVVTLKTVARHGFEPGQQFYLSGADNGSFAGVFTIDTVPSNISLTYRQAGPDARSGGGTLRITNLRAISLVTPGFNLWVNRNTFQGVGGMTLEPSSEQHDGDIEICGNQFRDVDATNILVRTKDGTTVGNVRISGNRAVNAGRSIGKGCIAVGENTGDDAMRASFRHVLVTDNTCEGWGNWAGASIGISVAGAATGSNTENVVIRNNVLNGRTADGLQPSSGYGIFLRNYTAGFQIVNNRISNSGRSCIATTGVSDGIIEGNLCTSPVQWSVARRPDPAHQGCYQLDFNSVRITVHANACSNPGTPQGPANGYYIADSASVRSNFAGWKLRLSERPRSPATSTGIRDWRECSRHTDYR